MTIRLNGIRCNGMGVHVLTMGYGPINSSLNDDVDGPYTKMVGKVQARSKVVENDFPATSHQISLVCCKLAKLGTIPEQRLRRA